MGQSVIVLPSDRALDPAIAAQAIARQFPELANRAVDPLGAGWDYEVYACGEIAFRFPKRAEQVAWLAREVEVLRVVGTVLGSTVPDLRYFGEPSSDFPYPFVGYPILPGVPAVGKTPTGLLAADLGAVLTRLHRLDPRLVPATPTGEEPLAAGGHRLDLSSCADAVREYLPSALRGAAEPYLAGSIPLPSFDGERVLAHNDICAEHVLIDSASGRLVGVIDWTDAMVTDPAVDFVGLVTIGDWSFIRAVQASYSRPLDDNFGRRVTWLARTMTLRWLGDVLEEGNDPTRHVAWVERAFADQPRSPNQAKAGHVRPAQPDPRTLPPAR
jgi:aminoglycoside phosphotransferase (APT) family kinase protein